MLPHELQGFRALIIGHHLYLAIIHARIRKGDWRTAYPNLDMAFRLWLSTTNYNFLKRVLKERAFHEGYQVYFLFC